MARWTLLSQHGAVVSSAVVSVQELRSLGLQSGLAAVGVTDVAPFSDVLVTLQARAEAGLHAGMQFTYRRPEVATDPARLLPESRALVVGALAYPHDAEPAAIRGAGRVAAYAWRDYYADLRDALGVLSGRLRADGWRTRIVIDDNALVDRAAAHRAGLGWWGKNANLLVPGVGSWVVLGAVATDAPLLVNADPVADGCGPCRRCVDGCPTGAITEPGVVDARRCLSWLLQDAGSFPREYRVALGDRIYGCDDCQEVCPPSRGAIAPRPDTDLQQWVDIVELLGLQDAALLEAAGRWYVAKRDPRYLRRNLLVVLGNVGDPGDRRVRAAVETHVASADCMLRAHAAWAAARLGYHDLLGHLREDRAEEVLAELAAIDAGAVPDRSAPWPSRSTEQ